jgi:hypothetical protein
MLRARVIRWLPVIGTSGEVGELFKIPIRENLDIKVKTTFILGDGNDMVTIFNNVSALLRRSSRVAT